MTEMGDAGFVTGVVFGAATALAFLLACLYSAYKAIKDRKRILAKNEGIRAQRIDEAAELAGDSGEPVQNQTQHNGTATGAASAASLTTPAQEERRPSAAFKPPPAPPEKQWEQKGVHYRSEGGVMHIHKSDSKLSTGPGDEAEKEPLMSAPQGGASSEDKAEETETVPQKSETTAATSTPTTTTTSTSETTENSETTVQVHVTVSVTEHQDQVITSTSTEGLKQLETSTTTDASGTTKVHKLFTSATGDGARTQTGTELPDVANGSGSADPAAWV